MNLVDRLRAALAADASGVTFLPGDLRHADVPDAPDADAAVLVAITDRPEPGLILTRRPDTMRRHAGQVAFPGGRIDAGDADAAAAALREAWEEIALPPDAVTLVGSVEPYRTVTGFLVTPVLGVVPPDLPLVANPAEVAEVFEVPFGFVLDAANQREVAMEWQGRQRHYYQMEWEGHRIWGATAAMLVNLSRRLRWAA